MSSSSQSLSTSVDLHQLSATDIQVKTWSVQQILAPLIIQVTDLVDDCPSECLVSADLGRSRSAKRLLSDLVRAIDGLCQRSSNVFSEFAAKSSSAADLWRKSFLGAVEAVKDTGSQLVLVSKSFVEDPQDAVKRHQVVGAARPLLFAVARLLTVVDMLDVDLLASEVEDASAYVRKVGGILKDKTIFRALSEHVSGICERAFERQNELISETERDRLALLRFRIGKQLSLVARAREIADDCHKNDKSSLIRLHSSYVGALASSLNEMANGLKSAAGDDSVDEESTPILTLLDRFQLGLESDGRNRQDLEGCLERIIRRIGLLADQSWVDKLSRRDLVAVCNDARQALQDYLGRRFDAGYVEKVCDRVRSLIRQLLCSRLSDLWIERGQFGDLSNQSSLANFDRVLRGYVDVARSSAQVFDRRSSSNQRYAQLACEDLRVLDESALRPAIELALSAAGKSESSRALVVDCLRMCERLLDVIQDCIDNDTPLDDALKVIERKLVEKLDAISSNDSEKAVCCEAVERIVGRLGDYFANEMVSAPEALAQIQNELVPQLKTIDQHEIGVVCDRLRSALKSVCKWSDYRPADERLSAGQHIDLSRDVMRRLPQSEIDQIERHCQLLHRQKRVFDREVLKWDERGNDIVLLAKKMCLIMMDMSDFTRAKGPLHSTLDLIDAAKRISQFGTKLDRLARQVAIECVQSQSKQDLLAYLDRVSLFTHQLNITSRVKADVQNVSGELVVSGLDSATSLITSAKNLMNSVILVVKATYIASTKYPKPAKLIITTNGSSNPSLNSETSSSGVVTNIKWNVVAAAAVQHHHQQQH